MATYRTSGKAWEQWVQWNGPDVAGYQQWIGNMDPWKRGEIFPDLQLEEEAQPTTPTEPATPTPATPTLPPNAPVNNPPPTPPPVDASQTEREAFLREMGEWRQTTERYFADLSSAMNAAVGANSAGIERLVSQVAAGQVQGNQLIQELQNIGVRSDARMVSLIESIAELGPGVASLAERTQLVADGQIAALGQHLAAISGLFETQGAASREERQQFTETVQALAGGVSGLGTQMAEQFAEIASALNAQTAQGETGFQAMVNQLSQGFTQLGSSLAQQQEGVMGYLQAESEARRSEAAQQLRFQQEQVAQQRLQQEQQRAEERQDSFARVTEVLNQYGLGTLGGLVWDNLIEGRSENEITQRIRESPEYKVRFAGMEERRRKGLAPISEAEYVDYEKNAAQMMKRAGLPPGFYDSKADITKFIAGDVSLAELNDRVNLAKQAVFEVPTETRLQLQRMYGVGPNELAAFFIDPDVAEPIIKKRFTASQIAGAGRRTGFGDLRTEEAERLASLGITEEQAQQGFGQLNQASELFQALPGERDAEIGRAEQLAAAFEGDTSAQSKIERKRSRRRAEFQQGGGFASTQGGVSGLGS